MANKSESFDKLENEPESLCIPQGDEWMTLKDATAYTKIKRGTLYQLMNEKILRWYRVTGTSQRRFKRSDLDKLMVLGESEEDASDMNTDDG